MIRHLWNRFRAAALRFLLAAGFVLVLPGCHMTAAQAMLK